MSLSLESSDCSDFAFFEAVDWSSEIFDSSSEIFEAYLASTPSSSAWSLASSRSCHSLNSTLLTFQNQGLVRFQQTPKQGLRQMLLMVSWDLRA